MSRDEPVENQHQFAGGVALFLGIGLLLLILLDTAYGLPWAMPPTWYVHRTLWGAVALAFCGAGWFLQRGRTMDVSNWKPAAPGRRFRRLVVYSRADCHLCDDAKAVLAAYLEYLPEIEVIDIDLDHALKERFDTQIPVVEIDGEMRFHGRVDEILLRRLLEATPPSTTSQTETVE